MCKLYISGCTRREPVLKTQLYTCTGQSQCHCLSSSSSDHIQGLSLHSCFFIQVQSETLWLKRHLTVFSVFQGVKKRLLSSCRQKQKSANLVIKRLCFWWPLWMCVNSDMYILMFFVHLAWRRNILIIGSGVGWRLPRRDTMEYTIVSSLLHVVCISMFLSLCSKSLQSTNLGIH